MANLTLRVLTREGDTTKNAPLTNAEVDTNFINLDADLDVKANLVSPTFTGVPAAPTASVGTNTTQLATTAFVHAERSSTSTLSNKSLTTPVLTGTAAGSTAGRLGYSGGVLSFGDGTNQKVVVTTDNTQTLTNKIISLANNTITGAAPLESPTFTGVPAAPTASAGTNTTQLATTAFVFAERAATVTLTNKTINIASNTLTGVAPLASPTFTGTPAAPTASVGTNTTQLATTAFVFAERAATVTLTNKTLTSPVITYNTQIVSTNTTAVASRYYVATATLTLTLPASPTAGQWVGISNRSATTTVVIGRNSQNIMGLAENMTIDSEHAGFRLLFADSTRGWVIV
jgi:hypothetical protein